MSWKVYFFQTARGRYPVKEFVEEQDIPTRAKIARSIRFLADHGPFLKPPYIKKIQSNLYELRISGNVAVRIFYTVFKNEYFLLHSFKKESQKTPAKELRVALDRMKEII